MKKVVAVAAAAMLFACGGSSAPDGLVAESSEELRAFSCIKDLTANGATPTTEQIKACVDAAGAQWGDGGKWCGGGRDGGWSGGNHNGGDRGGWDGGRGGADGDRGGRDGGR